MMLFTTVKKKQMPLFFILYSALPSPIISVRTYCCGWKMVVFHVGDKTDRLSWLRNGFI